MTIGGSQVPALVVSAGRQGVAVTRALGERGVPVVVLGWHAVEPAAASRYAVGHIRVPQPDQGDGAFVSRLLELATSLRGAVLIPVSDEAVADVARAKDVLSEAYVVDCPSWDIAKLFIDKRNTYEIAERIGVPIPRTVVPKSSDGLAELGTSVGYPCLVKPRQVHLYAPRFGRKVTVVGSLEELRRAYGEAEEAGVDVLVQELIPGEDAMGVNYNSYRSEGRVVAECTARKQRLAPPRYGMPRVVVSEDVPEVVPLGRALLDAVGLDGFSCTEFKYDARARTWKLFEINGRHNHSAWLSVRSGINFPWLSYLDRLGRDLPNVPAARSGLYWIDEVNDLRQGATRAGRDGRGPRELLRPWTQEHVFALWDPEDPGPFKALTRAVPRRFARRLTAGLGQRSASRAAAERSGAGTAGRPER